MQDYQFYMLNQEEISSLNENEIDLLFDIHSHYHKLLEIDQIIKDGTLHVIIKSPFAGHDIEIFYDKNDMVLSIGVWTHTHPETIEELLIYIDRIVNEQIIIWKVTCPDGHCYAGHYDILEWEKDPDMVDEPDTFIEKGDRIERSTFKKIIENKLIE